ncbi:uncharacterized protein PGTG_04691 [Puccinia graminis f. sp. tritici CRL 75-36-700-3]|uniref:Uncharacterized protein n=1 Tax=Puccinia graminis f. sp. tritici (strain CRL 75-36-700-3 / race SCCL) TaxID=418459 RepID=E3K3T3_PUCGT|nr:uncharacterized protein PGTG_04691 [Puccinia graminis f. sp. tritici CRL 75-36-700-3]EFP78735.1 hypothetical protein PGTG_04691 [Puccinia graminis f. sp. tritici CRL 75-36-700-3]
MRVSCFFVSAAIMLAEQTSALPIGGLPTLASEGKYIHSLAPTFHPVPLVGGLTDKLLEDPSKGGLIATSDLVGEDGLVDTDGPLGKITGSLRRRQGLPLVGALGSLANGVQSLPLLGSVGSVAPVTQGLTSRVGTLGGAPISPSLGKLPSIIKRESGIPTIPVISSLRPVVSSMRDLNATALGNEVTHYKPFTSGMSMPNFFKRAIGLNSLPSMGSFPGASSLTSFPGFSSFPSMPSLPGMSSLPSMPSLPGMGSLTSFPSMPSLPSMSTLPSLPSMPSVPGISSAPGLSTLTSGGLPGMSSLGGIP